MCTSCQRLEFCIVGSGLGFGDVVTVGVVSAIISDEVHGMLVALGVDEAVGVADRNSNLMWPVWFPRRCLPLRSTYGLSYHRSGS